MTDYTSSLAESQVGRSDDSLGRWVCKKITFTSTTVGATGTHNLITIPAKNFVAGGYFAITTALVSTSNNGTIYFGAAGAMTGTYTADGTECALGDVISLFTNDFEDTAGTATYLATADTLDIVVATNAITAGEGYLMVRLVDLTGE